MRCFSAFNAMDMENTCDTKCKRRKLMAHQPVAMAHVYEKRLCVLCDEKQQGDPATPSVPNAVI